MAKKTVNIGTVANDKTGDPLRDAMGKINDNFTEIYTPAITPSAVNRTLLLSDNNTIITMTSSSACSVTIPAYSSVAFPVGACIVVAQLGAGQVTILGPSVTLYSIGSSVTISDQYGIIDLIHISAGVWLISGSLT